MLTAGESRKTLSFFRASGRDNEVEEGDILWLRRQTDVLQASGIWFGNHEQ